MAAWGITVDVLRFIATQLYAFSFAILARAIEDSDSEFSRFQCDVIKDTCIAVYQECKKHMLPYLKNLFEKYEESPRIRLPEFIPSNSVFATTTFGGV